MTLNPGVTPLVGSAREGQAGPDPARGVPLGVAERPVVPLTPGITPARKFRMLLHTNPTRERGEYLGTRADASEDM